MKYPFFALRLAFPLLILTLLISVLAGCGNGQSTGSGIPDPVKACEILTQKEVEALIRTSVDAPRITHTEKENPKHWMSMCNYYSGEKNISIGITIIPHGRKVTGGKAFALYEADLKKNLGEDYKMTPVKGVGDHAGWEKTTKQLTIFQGPFMVILSADSPDIKGDKALALNKQLAEKVLPKLAR